MIEVYTVPHLICAECDFPMMMERAGWQTFVVRCVHKECKNYDETYGYRPEYIQLTTRPL